MTLKKTDAIRLRERAKRAWGEQKHGEKRGGVERERGGGGEKRNRLQSIPNI